MSDSLNITQQDRLMAANMASIAVRRCDSPVKAVAVLMMAAIVVAFEQRDQAKAFFHFVASVKATFNALADETFAAIEDLKGGAK